MRSRVQQPPAAEVKKRGERGASGREAAGEKAVGEAQLKARARTVGEGGARARRTRRRKRPRSTPRSWWEIQGEAP